MNTTSSLQVTDNQSKAVQKTPYRISLKMIEDSIDHVDYERPFDTSITSSSVVQRFGTS